MLTKPADPYDLLRGNWVEEDPHRFNELTKIWLDAADDYVGAGTELPALMADCADEELATVAAIPGNLSRSFSNMARGAEATAVVMADTTRVVTEARATIAQLVREGTGQIAAAASGAELISSYRQQIAAVKNTYAQVMLEPSRAERLPMLMSGQDLRHKLHDLTRAAAQMGYSVSVTAYKGGVEYPLTLEET